MSRLKTPIYPFKRSIAVILIFGVILIVAVKFSLSIFQSASVSFF